MRSASLRLGVTSFHFLRQGCWGGYWAALCAVCGSLPFSFFSPNPDSLARCAHVSVSLFPSAAPIPPHLGIMAAGHRALRGTAECGGEYLGLGLGSR